MNDPPPITDPHAGSPCARRHAAGFVALLGVPNVGKSTLLNRLLGSKLAIVTPKPQTTRDRILGVLTGEQGQIVLLDTPGVHRPDRSLNTYMVKQALATLNDADVAVIVVDAAATTRGRGAADVEQDLARRAAERDVALVVCLNKIDLVEDKALLLPLMERWSEARAVVPVSALQGEGVTRLLDEIWACLPEGPAYFDADELTDRSQRWLAAEVIREQVFLRTKQEVPYATAVRVERFVEREDRGDVVIEAIVYVERDSQRGILVGRGGSRIKEIGVAARAALSELLERPVHVKLRVLVMADWARSDAGLRRVGYDE
jgi:GTP-binding protein Era